MNTIQNKSYLWDQCSQKGLFVNIPSNSSEKVQALFESAVERFSGKKEDISVLNQQFLDSFKDEIVKMNSFEERQKEYDEMLKNKPAPIDFTEKINEPVQSQEMWAPAVQEPRKEVDWAHVIKSQNDILIKILETQIKIMYMLQKK
jgi:benzoyl-CoA reductase/2-hydroxyglutaryl-CoA dehydratase subunit BcrC/BadD/HgdB